MPTLPTDSFEGRRPTCARTRPRAPRRPATPLRTGARGAALVLGCLLLGSAGAELAPEAIAGPACLTVPLSPARARLAAWLDPDEADPLAGRGHPPEACFRAPRATSEAPLPRTEGLNLTACALRLESDYGRAGGFFLRAEIANSGTLATGPARARFSLGHPDSGGMGIGGEVRVPPLAPGERHFCAVRWAGRTGETGLYLIVDPEDTLVEADETDNTARLGAHLRDDVPWVWQIVNGYCNYAGLTMLYNYLGCTQSVYQSVELAGCGHSALYVEEKFYLPGGIMVCQGMSDYVFAGEIRNLQARISVCPDWSTYVRYMKLRLADEIPFVTSVDPYYLPQADWDPLREYDIHSGHAVVVTGYTDSSVVVNDPGVGLPILGDPLPDPELRGSDVVMDWETFHLAVAATWGTSYILISYTPLGALPTENEILAAAVEQSVQRLNGDPDSYDPAWVHGWPSGWTPRLGIDAYTSAHLDLTPEAFEAHFAALLAAAGGELEAVLMALSLQYVDGFFWAQIAWEASRAYLGTLPLRAAREVAWLADDLAGYGEAMTTIGTSMILAIHNAGGDPTVAAPYLAQLAQRMDAVTDLEEQVLAQLELLADHLSETAPLADRLAAEGDPRAAESGLALPRIDPVLPALCSAPNPFAGATEIRWTAGSSASEPRAARTLGIYDASGRLVRRLSLGSASGTEGRIAWDGCDGGGVLLPRGTYFARDELGSRLRLVKLR